MAEIVIHEGNYEEVLRPEGYGLTPRDFAANPLGSLTFAPPFDIPLIPESEWQSRLDAQKAAKAQLSDIRMRGDGGKMIPARNQKDSNYCWAHSSTGAVILGRAVNNLPYRDLSAFAVACKIKGFRNQGGWGGESMEFIAETGVPTSEFWPLCSWDRSNDNPKTWENAALHKATEWMEIDSQQMKAQLVTCLLLDIPVVSDFNWWSHSVVTIDLVSLNPFQTRILNSWGDDWSTNGMGILEGRRAIPSDAVALRVVTASAS
jgi:hypothetical protein